MSKTRGVRTYVDKRSNTDPNDPEAVPAFETSAGIPPGNSRPEPILVNATALANFNASVDPDVQKRQIEATNVAAMFAKRAIRPDEIAALRRRMLEVVQSGVEDVAQVLQGKKEWNNQQVRLFSILVDRVMPKVSNVNMEQKQEKKLDELSIEELEALALGKKNHQAIDAVVKEGDRLDKEASKEESKDVQRRKISKVALIASIDDAADKHVKKRGKKQEIGVDLKKPTA
jgi:hypothetical protein